MLQHGTSLSIPAPVGGWNARDPLDLMEPQDAVRLVNAFPGTSSVSLRRGFEDFGTTGSYSVETLAELALASGTRKLVSGDSNGEVFSMTTAGGAGTSLGSGFTNGRWQSVNFRDNIILVNGSDQPKKYDGTTFSDATYTGIADDSKLIQCTAYKSRLYFIEKDSTKVWYGGVNNITGALTEFDVGSLLKLGGNLCLASSWTRDSGDGLADLLVIVSELGEVLLYTGDYPGDTAWRLAGRFYMPEPLDRRADVHIGSDLTFITKSGFIPLNGLFSQQGAIPTISDKIQDAVNSSGILYGTNFGWHGLRYPKRNMLIFNVPKTEGTGVAESEQYVMNTLTGAWCKYTMDDVVSMSLLGGHLYFGDSVGNIRKADSTYSDNGTAIQMDIKQAFNYFGDRENTKHFTFAKPIIRSTGSISINVDVDVDFQDIQETGEVTTEGSSGSEWDADAWDVAEWGDSDVLTDDWFSVTGIGRAAALKLQGSFNNVGVELTASSIMFKRGRIL